MFKLRNIPIDSFLVLIIVVVLFAFYFPCQGDTKTVISLLAKFAIALLFFMHGAKLSRQALFKGFAQWRLHLAVFCSTFVLFPLLGLSMQVLVPTMLTQEIYLGFLFLCALPGTVQSAIAFTSIAKGNIAASICSSSASSILGVFLSPILVGLFMKTQGISYNFFDSILSIVLQIMVPFIIGHLLRPFIYNLIEKHRSWINKMDRSSILLIVYLAFSDATVEGVWLKVNNFLLFTIIGCCTILLLIVIMINIILARYMNLPVPDEVTLVFCGSKKSLINGIPMANVLFPVSMVGVMVLPIMIYHQIQLIVCALIAPMYAKKVVQQGDKLITNN